MFTLNTQIATDDLDRFHATGSSVVVAKGAPGSTPNVAWIALQPLDDNCIEWQEEYGIYASNVEVTQSGATLHQISTTGDAPVVDGLTYPLTAAGHFGAPTKGGDSGSFYAFNDFDNLEAAGYLTFGLFQHANVNGKAVKGNAVSAAPVIYKSTADLTPYTTVSLWVQSAVRSNSVVTTVSSPITQVTFGGKVSTVSLRYDATQGNFVTVASS